MITGTYTRLTRWLHRRFVTRSSRWLLGWLSCGLTSGLTSWLSCEEGAAEVIDIIVHLVNVDSTTRSRSRITEKLDPRHKKYRFDFHSNVYSSTVTSGGVTNEQTDDSGRYDREDHALNVRGRLGRKRGPCDGRSYSRLWCVMWCQFCLNNCCESGH